ncbi:putative abieta-7,13-dien-18-ol hydroxylase [Helianthus annuus]|nr:putative abieta-7,13-dien-18-ol hydroxylase [Helianthus annuus]
MAASMDFLSNPILMSVITSLCLVLLFHYFHQKAKPHGKKYHPIGATVFHLFINFNKMHHYMTDLAEKYKSYRILSPIQGEVYTADPANVEYILKTNFKNYGKGKHTHNIASDLLGDGIFTVDGDQWREQRKVSSQEFSTKILRDFSSVIFRNNTIKLGKILSQAADSNQIIDINDLFMKATTDSIFKVGFGIDLDNLSGRNEKGARFSRAFDDANNLTYKRFVDVTWKIKRFFNIGFEAELKKNMKIVDEFVYKVIQVKTEQMQKSKDEFLLKKEDILSRFIQVNDRDPKYLRDIILNFMLAGKDPIAISMCWFIYMLCKHPEVQEKVAKEIIEATNMTEEITDVADFAARVSDTALDKMQYLHAALTETIRLYPALPVDPKVCFSDDVLPDGCNVNKGDVVAYLPYAMGRMKYIWGDDALEFKPERWLDQYGCFHPESPFKFTAFQAGPRTCLGRDFAYRQLKILSSVLLGWFVFKLSNENKVPQYRTSINLHVDGPLQVYVFHRSGFQNPSTYNCETRSVWVNPNQKKKFDSV